MISRAWSGPGPGHLDPYPSHLSRPQKTVDKRVWITEGPLKGDIASDRLEARVLCIAGVSAWRKARIVERLDEMGVSEVVIAFDADKRTNPQVRGQERALAGALVSAGIRVQIAQWNLADGKGIDDLLLNGGEPRIEDWTGHTDSLVTVPRQVSAQSQSTLDQAREEHRKAVHAALTGEDTRPLFVTSATGTGKTQALFDELHSLLRSDDWPKERRVLYVADTRKQIGCIQDDFPWMSNWQDRNLAVIRTGRDKANCHPDQLDLTNALGGRRHSVKKTICNNCLYRNECEYIKTECKASNALLTIATKDAIFHNPDLLNQYQAIIVDEDLLSRCLFDGSALLKCEDIREWLEGMDRLRLTGGYDDHHPLRKLSNLLSAALQQVRGIEMIPLVRVLRTLAESIDILTQLIEAAHYYQPKHGTFDFEERNGTRIPLRMMSDLLDRLVIEKNRPEGADTRLWISRHGIQLYVFREEAMATLKKCTFIALDATPPPAVLEAFDDARIVQHHVPEQIYVTQITDDLLPKRTLERPEKRSQVRRAIQQITQDAERPAVFVPKAYNPDAGGVDDLRIPGAVYGHYGRDNRAINDRRFMDADVLVLVGIHFHAIDHQVALAQAMRDRPDVPEEQIQDFTYKTYLGQDKARRIPAHADPEIHRAIDHQASAEALQAIGRARAVGRKGAPLRVYILTAYPITGLKVDELTTLKALAGDEGGVPAPLAALNIQRAAESEDRYQHAIAQLTARDQKVTVRAVLALAGGSATTASKAIKKRRESVSMGLVTHTRFNNYSVTLPVCNKAGRKMPERMIIGLCADECLTCLTCQYSHLDIATSTPGKLISLDRETVATCPRRI